MIIIIRFLTLHILCLSTSGLVAQSTYTFKKADPEGTGKWYYGREIAPVMSHYGIGWLERTEREEEENTSLLLKNMAVTQGERVADIGAGSGYHVVRLASLVGNTGKVYAVDIQQEMLDYLAGRVKKLGFSNVEMVKGTEKNTRLKSGTIDKMLLVDVYHEFEFPKEMSQSIYESLRPGGLVFLIEFRAEDVEVPIKRVHKMTEKQAVTEMEAAGFLLIENKTNLPWQHCLIFRKPK